MSSFVMSAAKVAAIAVTAAIASAGVASASTIINFDTDGGVLTGGNPKTYTVGDYRMTPVNIQGGLCAGDPGPSSCTIESTQTVEPTLTRISGQSYNLEGFYFLNTGNGSGSDNFISLTAYDKDNNVVKDVLKFTLDDLLSGFFTTYGINVAYAVGGSDPTCDLDNKAYICKNTGYYVTLNGYFDGIYKAVWKAEGDANARLDDIKVSGPPVVPLPAAGWLMLAGLGGLAALRKRKAA